MYDIEEELNDAAKILHRYLRIHNAIFKFSFRKVFKPIEYSHHFSELSSLVLKLEKISKPISQKQDVPEVFKEYTFLLLETMRVLSTICGKLHEKSEGDLNSYPMKQYQIDLAKYENFVDRYSVLGAKLNLILVRG